MYITCRGLSCRAKLIQICKLFINIKHENSTNTPYHLSCRDNMRNIGCWWGHTCDPWGEGQHHHGHHRLYSLQVQGIGTKDIAVKTLKFTYLSPSSGLKMNTGVLYYIIIILDPPPPTEGRKYWLDSIWGKQYGKGARKKLGNVKEKGEKTKIKGKFKLKWSNKCRSGNNKANNGAPGINFGVLMEVKNIIFGGEYAFWTSFRPRKVKNTLEGKIIINCLCF